MAATIPIEVHVLTAVGDGKPTEVLSIPVDMTVTIHGRGGHTTLSLKPSRLRRAVRHALRVAARRF